MEIKLEHKDSESGIYKLTNTKSNKIYIGSSKDLYYRLKRHLSDLKKCRHANNYLQNAYNLDSEHFVAEVLELCNENQLLDKEQFYIDTLKPEYNITLIVERNAPSIESRKKISETLKRKYKSGEIISYKQNHAWKKVYLYDLDGHFVGEFDSPKIASDTLNIPYVSLNTCLKGNFRRCDRFQAFFEKQDNVSKIKFHSNSKNIVYEHQDKTYIADSLVQLAEILNVHRSSLQKAVKVGKYKKYPLYYPAPEKLDELLETLEVDNQQPS